VKSATNDQTPLLVCSNPVLLVRPAIATLRLSVVCLSVVRL